MPYWVPAPRLALKSKQKRWCSLVLGVPISEPDFRVLYLWVPGPLTPASFIPHDCVSNVFAGIQAWRWRQPLRLAWCTSCKLWFSEVVLDGGEHVLVDFRMERLCLKAWRTNRLAQLLRGWMVGREQDGAGGSVTVSVHQRASRESWCGTDHSPFLKQASLPVFLHLTALPVLHHCLQPFSFSLWISRAT